MGVNISGKGVLSGLATLVAGAVQGFNLLASKILGFTSILQTGSGYYGASLVERIAPGFLLTNRYSPPSYSADFFKTAKVSPGNGLTLGTQFGFPSVGNGYFVVAGQGGGGTTISYAYSKDAISWTSVALPTESYSSAQSYFHNGKFFVLTKQNVYVGSDPSDLQVHPLPLADEFSTWYEIPMPQDINYNFAGSFHLLANSPSRLARWEDSTNSFVITASPPNGYGSLEYTNGYYVAYGPNSDTPTAAYRMAANSDLSTWEEITVPKMGSVNIISKDFWVTTGQLPGLQSNERFINISSNAGTTWSDFAPVIYSYFGNLTTLAEVVPFYDKNQEDKGIVLYIKGHDSEFSYSSYLAKLSYNGSNILDSFDLSNNYISELMGIVDETYYFTGGYIQETNNYPVYGVDFSAPYIYHISFPLQTKTFVKRIGNTYIAIGQNFNSPGGYIEVYTSNSPTFENIETLRLLGDYWTWSNPVYLEDMTTYVQVQASIGNQADETVEVLAPVDVYTVPNNTMLTLEKVSLQNTTQNTVLADIGFTNSKKSLTDENAVVNDQSVSAGSTYNYNTSQVLITGESVTVLPSTVDAVTAKVYGTTEPVFAGIDISNLPEGIVCTGISKSGILLLGGPASTLLLGFAGPNVKSIYSQFPINYSNSSGAGALAKVRGFSYRDPEISDFDGEILSMGFNGSTLTIVVIRPTPWESTANYYDSSTNTGGLITIL